MGKWLNILLFFFPPRKCFLNSLLVDKNIYRILKYIKILT